MMNIMELFFKVVFVSYMYIAVGWGNNDISVKSIGLDSDHIPLKSIGLDNDHISVKSTEALKNFAVPTFTSQSVNVPDDLHPVNRTIKKIQAGIDAGKGIVDLLGSKELSTTFGKIGEIARKIGPFLGAIGPLFGFLGFFFPKGPSPELQLMTKKFAEMNKRFDQVVAGIDDLKDLIEHTTMDDQYGQYQITINTLSKSLDKVFDARANNSSQEIIDDRIADFIALYDKSNIDTALEALYEGLAENTPLTIPIPETIREFTHDDRLKTQNMMKGILSILLKGVKVLLAYHQFQNHTSEYQEQQKDWTANIQTITTHMQDVDKEIKERYSDQVITDVNKILSEKKDLSTNELTNDLMNFLRKKYDWKSWWVQVNRYKKGESSHSVQTGDIFTWFRIHKDDLRVFLWASKRD